AAKLASSPFGGDAGMPAMVDTHKTMAKWVRVVCTFALLCVGFAHEPPGAGARSPSPRLLAHYTFPDGTLPVLCLTGEDDGGSRGHAFGTGCEACRLTADVVAPMPVDAGSWPVLHRVGVMPPQRIGTPGR